MARQLHHSMRRQAMVELSSRAHALNLGSAAALGSAGTIGSASSSAGDSFTQELETAIQGILSQSGNGSQFEIDIQSGQSASGGNDYTITVKNLGSGAANSAASGSSSSGAVSSAPATGSGAGATSALSALMPSPASASSASAATTAAAIVGSAGSKPAAIINVPRQRLRHPQPGRHRRRRRSPH